jgi:hypothetical protein
MPQVSPAAHAFRLALLVGAAIVVGACSSETPLVHSVGDHLEVGTWGGDNVGVIVSDTDMHVHVGCTYGDVSGRVPLDSSGHFGVSGSYLLRAYPVAIGPTMPAQFTGHVAGSTVTITVTVNDTIAHTSTVLGPATAVLGKTPSMGPCPICRTNAERMAHRRPAPTRPSS